MYVMKAVIVPEYGAPEVLKLVSVPKPKLGPDELLVKTKLSINYMILLLIISY